MHNFLPKWRSEHAIAGGAMPPLRVTQWAREVMRVLCTAEELRAFLTIYAEETFFAPAQPELWLESCVASVTSNGTVPDDAFDPVKWPQALSPLPPPSPSSSSSSSSTHASSMVCSAEEKEKFYRNGGSPWNSDDDGAFYDGMETDVEEKSVADDERLSV